MRRIALLLMLATLGGSLGGCYLGRTPGRKVASYVANGSLVVGGLSGISHAQQQSDDADLVSTMLLVPLIVGLAGIAINAAIPTQEEAAPTVGRMQRPIARR